MQSTLRGNKVNMITHTYPRKPIRQIKVVVHDHRVDSPFYSWPDVCSGDLQETKREYRPTMAPKCP